MFLYLFFFENVVVGLRVNVIFHILKVEEKDRIDENDIVVEENVSGESEIVVRNERER